MNETIREIGNQLSSIFRHLLPGVVIVLLANISHPEWLYHIKFSDWWSLVILATITITIGNVWYTFHRYTLHQFIDWILYLIRKRNLEYLNWLSNHIIKSFSHSEKHEELLKHLRFRNSQIILMFIVSEALILFSLWHSKESYFFDHHCIFTFLGLILLILSIIQYCVSHSIDLQIVDDLK